MRYPLTAHRVRNLLHNGNYAFAQGVTRTVFLIGPYAFKVPATTEWRLFLLGLLANMQERAFAAVGWPELCPVVWAAPGGWLVIMRRARELTEDEFESFDYGAFVANEAYCVPVEQKASSFGWLDGRVVAIDYGN